MTGSPQLIVGGYYDALNNAATEYNCVNGGALFSATEASFYQVVPTAGVFTKLSVKLSASPNGAGKSYDFTLRVGGGSPSSGLVATLTNTDTQIQDSIHSVSVVAGNYINLMVVPTGTPDAVYATWCVVFTPTNDGESIMLGGCGAISASADRYTPLMCGIVAANATQSNCTNMCPTDGIVKNLYVMLDVDPGTNPDAYSFTVYVNSTTAANAPSVTITADATMGNDTSSSGCVVTAGNRLTLYIHYLNTPAVAPNYVAWGCVFLPTNKGESVIMNSQTDLPSASATEYMNASGTTLAQTWGATESQRGSLTIAGFTLTKMYIGRSGTTTTGTISVRKAAGNTGLTWSGTAATGNDTSHTYSTVDYELIDILNTAGTGTQRITVVGICVFSYATTSVTSSVLIGQLTTASRIYGAVRSAIVSIGKLVSASYTVPLAPTVFYPDADPETTSVDGEVWVDAQKLGHGVWSLLHDADGSSGCAASDNDETSGVIINAGQLVNFPDVWGTIIRSDVLFDISSLPAGITITGATLSLFNDAEDSANTFTISSFAMNVYSSNPSSNTALVAGDFPNFGTTPFCETAIPFSSWSGSQYYNFVLNSAGLSAISSAYSGSKIVKLGVRESLHDVANSEPVQEDNAYVQFLFYTSEHGEGYKPKLTITYTTSVNTNVYTAIIFGAVSTASKIRGTVRSTSLLIGQTISASRVAGYIRSASTQTGNLVSASRIAGYIRNSSVIVGITTTASRIFGTVRSTAVSIGHLVSASRLVDYIRNSSVVIGVVSTASRFVDYTRASGIIFGNLVDATYAKITGAIRTCSIAFGQTVSASRFVDYTRSASVLIGHLVSASRRVDYTIQSAPVIFGNVVSASWSRITAYFELAIITFGQTVSASRLASYTRSATNQIGSVVVATKSIGLHVTSTIQYGITTTASRIVGRIVSSSIVIGQVATASKVLGYVRNTSVQIGNTIQASRIVGYYRYATVSIGQSVTAGMLRLIKIILSFFQPLDITLTNSQGLTITTDIESGLDITLDFKEG